MQYICIKFERGSRREKEIQDTKCIESAVKMYVNGKYSVYLTDHVILLFRSIFFFIPLAFYARVVYHFVTDLST